MKRILLAAILLLGLSMLTTSCQENIDEDDYAQLIIGTWQFDKLEHYVDGVLDDVEDDDYKLTFTKDGYAYVDDNPNEKEPYFVIGKTLNMEGIMVIIRTLTKNKMVWEYNEDGDVGMFYYTRVK